ncbi:hypothetical protein P691DRAFT_789526 [Macrolepiota fuliginosa MF-IS2]|uniref:Uncharacterized protein n=1 Tax=Macrolepiota fuliginosa MF-IS2 TaxID=1400762 RepID=A0A9P5X171_9AGAR|nr:hypothetical protein P691DRAFT_789526 [Macrolepiota fuliginosa MF-IS2]
MNQDRHVASKFTREELERIVPPIDIWLQVVAKLICMNFEQVDGVRNIVNTSTPLKVDNNEDALETEELSPIGEFTNAIAQFGKWNLSNTIADDNEEHAGLLNNITQLAKMFNLIPAPHHCPPPLPPCVHPHQDDAPPCLHPHIEDAPPPLPCQHPHCDDKDISMELLAPTHAFSEAASQTPAPSHEASMPPPPPAAVASIPPAGPSHCQFFIEVPTIPNDTFLPTLVTTANRALVWAKSILKVDLACFSPCGITCATAIIPSTSNLNIIEATLSSRLLGVHVSILASQSFIKIIDVPYFKIGTTDPFTKTHIYYKMVFTAIEAVDTNQRNDKLQMRKSRQAKQDEIFKTHDHKVVNKDKPNV